MSRNYGSCRFRAILLLIFQDHTHILHLLRILVRSVIFASVSFVSQGHRSIFHPSIANMYQSLTSKSQVLLCFRSHAMSTLVILSFCRAWATRRAAGLQKITTHRLLSPLLVLWLGSDDEFGSPIRKLWVRPSVCPSLSHEFRICNPKNDRRPWCHNWVFGAAIHGRTRYR